jgi:hypothetical protein
MDHGLKMDTAFLCLSLMNEEEYKKAIHGAFNEAAMEYDLPAMRFFDNSAEGLVKALPIWRDDSKGPRRDPENRRARPRRWLRTRLYPRHCDREGFLVALQTNQQ